MNRTVAVGVLALVIGVLVTFIWLQEAKVKPLAEKVSSCEAKLNQKPTPAPCAQWETLSDGTKVLKVWDKIGPDWPQIALFYLTNDLYKEMEKDPSTFVNTRKIFPQDVRPHSKLIEAAPAPKSYTGAWVVMGTHHPASPSAYAAFPAEEKP
jgi:hypothetical protein